MLTISHILSSVFVLYLLSLVNPIMYPLTTPLIVFSMIFANIPDLDGLWSKKLNQHHQSLLHAPLFWILIFSIGIILAYEKVVPWGIIILAIIQITFHLVTDYLMSRSSGIPLLYPFSKKDYSPCSLEPECGNMHPLFPKKAELITFGKLYLKNKKLVVVEAGLSLLGIIVLFSRFH